MKKAKIPTADSTPRKLGDVLKCTSCRTQKIKCKPEARIWPQKCERCTKLKLSCDPGCSSKRAQKQYSLPARARVESEARNVNLECSPIRPNSSGSQNATNGQIGEESSNEHSSLGSLSSIRTPSQDDDFEQRCVIDDHGQASDFFSCASRTLEVHSWQRFQDHDISQSWQILDRDTALAQYLYEKPIAEAQDFRLSAIDSAKWSAQLVQLAHEPESQFFLSPGLLIEPSDLCIPDRMTYWSDRRIGRLWGNHRTFAETEQVSDLFGRTVSDFFGTNCRQMARMYPMVWEALYSCGAADALMNKKLPSGLRREYQRAYDLHDSRARNMIMQAISVFNEKCKRNEKPDALPLYYAAFLLHAAGACTKGTQDLFAAISVFDRLEKLTTEFPLRIKVICASQKKNDWTVRMLLASDPADRGMEIGRYSFILGRARRQFDAEENPFSTC